MKKTSAFVAAILCALLGIGNAASAAESKSEKTPELFETSFAYEATGNLDKSLNAVLQILRLDTGHYLGNLRAGWLNYRKGRYDESIKFYRKAISLKAKAIEPKLGMMLPMMAARRWSDAEVLAKEVLGVAPNNYLAGSRLAFIYFSLGKYRQAEKQYKRVLEAFPSEIDMMLGLGWTYVKQGRKKEAEEIFKEVLTIRRQNLNARAGLEALQ